MPRVDIGLATSLTYLVIVVWLLLRARRQNGALLRVGVSQPPSDTVPSLTVIVPARDESANIRRCLRSLLAQDYPSRRLRIVAIDDHSRDETAAIVASMALRDSRLMLLSAPPLPRGWNGKAHACWYALQVIPADTEWLCFLDADVRAHPLALASALQAARSRGLDLLSLAPRQELGSVAERLIIPCGLYVLGFSRDAARIQALGSEDALCTGQFMLVRREAYDAVGGFALVRDTICEDVAFARLLKGNGFRVRLDDGGALLVTRMYSGWGTLWPGFAKNLVDMLGGPWRTLWVATSAVALSWLALILPLTGAIGCARGVHLGCLALLPALLASMAVFALHLAGALRLGIPWWYALVFPLGYTTGALIALDSIRWRLVRRVHWKGRTYA